jgi:hypothetical protein
VKLRKGEFNLILKNGESYHVEFKAGFNKSFAREVTAFANASGGRIFLGVTDTGKPIGITIEDPSQKIGITNRSIERNLRSMQKKGVVKRIGPDKGGH